MISKLSKSDLKRAILNTLKGSSEKASDTCLSFFSRISFCPPNGSIKLPESSCAIALIVKSLLSKSSSNETLLLVSKLNPVYP